MDLRQLWELQGAKLFPNSPPCLEIKQGSSTEPTRESSNGPAADRK